MKKLSFVAFLAASLLLIGAVNCTWADSAKAALADKHKASGVECADCHGKNVKEVIPNDNCLACHESYAVLAQRTEDMHLNPHNSPHYYNLECVACHQGHKPMVNFCQDCHGPISRH